MYYNLLQIIYYKLQAICDTGDKKLGTQKPQMVLKHAMYTVQSSMLKFENKNAHRLWNTNQI